MRKLTYEIVKEAFEERGCVLLSEEYKKSKEKLEFICTCGNRAEISYDKFSQGQLCFKCRGKRSAQPRKHTYDFIKKVFEDGGCLLLTKEYLNGKQKLHYICECGNKAVICYSKFKDGQRCQKCKVRKIAKKLSGENSPKWDPNKTDEQRIKDRKYPEYREWRRNVYERDDYTCLSCGERGGKLNAHHIQAYAKFPELRTDVDNGVTLCYDCHKEYHQKIEHNTASLEGWEYFSGDYREPWYAGEEDQDAYFEYLERTHG